MNANRLEFLKSLAKGISSVFGDRCEVVIHDFSDLKKSLVYIGGDVTNRALGSPIPDMLYRLLKEYGDDAPNKFGYKSTTEPLVQQVRHGVSKMPFQFPKVINGHRIDVDKTGLPFGNRLF